MAARTVCGDLQISSLDSYPQFPGTILLHLYAAALARRAISPAIPALYIPVSSPFPALEAFISHAARVYNLSVFTCAPPCFPDAPAETSTGVGDAPAKGTDNMREALELYRARFPEVEAVLIGTRRTDPHGGALSIHLYASWFFTCGCAATLDFRVKTDPDWPPFVRVHPIINWDYADVWTFLRQLKIPYCSLYDEGSVRFYFLYISPTFCCVRYTSLGSTYNTFRNPALLMHDVEGIQAPSRERSSAQLYTFDSIIIFNSRLLSEPTQRFHPRNRRTNKNDPTCCSRWLGRYITRLKIILLRQHRTEEHHTSKALVGATRARRSPRRLEPSNDRQ